MIASVSMLSCTRGAATAVSSLNASISTRQRAGVRDASGDCGRRHRRWARQVRTRFRSLPALEIPVGRADHALPQPETFASCIKTHRAAGLAPFEAGGLEDEIQALLLREPLDRRRSWNADRAHAWRHLAILEDCRRAAQIAQSAVGAGADK